MLKYAVVEISGKQYKVVAEQALTVDFLGDIKNFECSKVLLKVEDDKISLGNPYLKEKLSFEVLGVQSDKIRVATYKAKANYRRVKGGKKLLSKINLSKAEKKP